MLIIWELDAESPDIISDKRKHIDNFKVIIVITVELAMSTRLCLL